MSQENELRSGDPKRDWQNQGTASTKTGIRERLTAEERAFIASCEPEGVHLTDQQVHLYIEQARGIGEL